MPGSLLNLITVQTNMTTREELIELFRKYDYNEISLEEFAEQLKIIIIKLRQTEVSEKDNFRELSLALDSGLNDFKIAMRHKRRGIPETSNDSTAEFRLKNSIEEIRDTLKVTPADYPERQSIINAKPEKFAEDKVEEITESLELLKDNQIKLIPISSVLLALMNESRKACQKKNIPYRTPNLLLVLLQMRDSLAKRALNKIELDLGQRYHENFESFIRNDQPRLEAGNSFIPFDWDERDDIRLSKKEAFVDRSPVVNQKHIFLGILQSNSNTAKEIREVLDDKFEKLLDIVRKEPSSFSINTSTVGTVLKPKNGTVQK